MDEIGKRDIFIRIEVKHDSSTIKTDESEKLFNPKQYKAIACIKVDEKSKFQVILKWDYKNHRYLMLKKINILLKKY